MVNALRQGAPVIAADIGGTKILAALFLPDGKLFAKATRPTNAAEGVNPVIDRLFSAFDDLLSQNGVKASQLEGIGIAC
ncbi:MAG TPA: hypothetical protein VMB24_02355, partial [Dehalococcoidales bacterium]|nr:hypothetical protein [Dehalococcoidales bacterium]